MKENHLESQERKESLYEAADRLKGEHLHIDDLVLSIGKFIHEHARSIPDRIQPQSIIESRFTSAQDAYDKGMMSCGSITNISAEMLKHLGYEVKLIHGECEKSVDHAWISVLNPEDTTWKEYDLTRADGSIPETHVKKQEISSWGDMKDQILKDHETLAERRKKRGI